MATVTQQKGYSKHKLPNPILSFEDTSNRENVPTWRAVLFTIVLPLPQECIPNGEGQWNHINLDCHKDVFRSFNQRQPKAEACWHRGRYKGIEAIAYREGGFEYRDPMYPRIYPMAPSRYFEKSLTHSLGFAKGDEEQDSDSVIASYHHLQCNELRNKTKCVLGKQESKLVNHLFEKNILPDDSSDIAGYRTGTVFLDAVEFAQFRSPLDEHGDNASFLILHIVAENITDRSLEAFSQHLYRSRNKLWGLDERAGRDGDVDFMRKCVWAAKDALNKGLGGREEGGFNFELRRTSTLGHPSVKGPSTSKLNHGSHESEVERQVVHNSLSLGDRAFRLVTALPYPQTAQNASKRPRRHYPRLFDQLDSQTNGTINPETYLRLWSWQLSTGFDEYAYEIPDVDANSQAQGGNTELLNWRTSVTPEGAAFIRHPDAVPGIDFTLFRLVSSRFVDLALLNIRADDALLQMRKQLDDASGVSRENRIQSLSDKLEKLNEVQTRLANFQKLYWFETVAGRREATHFLNQLQEETGTRQSYNEFRRQLDLQKEIVDTHHQELQEERSAQRQVTGERRNMLIGCLGILLAIPGLIELFLFEIPLGAKAIIVAAYLVLLMFVILSFRDILNIKGVFQKNGDKE